jgi:DNA adenine methylase
MTNAQHEALSEVLHGLFGMAIISGYRCDLYDHLYADWQRIDRYAMADKGKRRIESIWLSPRIPQVGLFGIKAA